PVGIQGGWLVACSVPICSLCAGLLVYQSALFFSVSCRTRHCLPLFAHKAVYFVYTGLSRVGAGNRTDWRLACRERPVCPSSAGFGIRGTVLAHRFRPHLRDSGL